MDEPVRIGIVGAGGIVRERHVPNLRAVEGAELAAVCNRTVESSEAAARELGIPAVFERWEDLVCDEDLDAVWIGTWPYLHHAITMEALAMGKHVFCQARMAMNAKQAGEMLEMANASGLTAMLCPPPMGMRGDFHFQDLLRDGAVGTPYSIHLRAMNASGIDPAAPLTWRQREDLSGVNTLFVGIYAEVIQRWFGYMRDVTACAKTFIHNRPREDGGYGFATRPDAVIATGEMLNGALLRCEWSALAAPAPASLLEVYGSGGALRYNFDTDEIAHSENGGEWRILEIPAGRVREWTVERDFINAVRGGGEARPNFYDGLKYMEYTEAVFESAKTGRRIELMR